MNQWELAAGHLSRQDPVLRNLVRLHGTPRVPRPRSGETHFSSLTRSILSQQLAGSAAAAIHRRFVDAVGGTVTPESVLATPRARFRESGLSGAKSAAILDLADKVTSGEVSLTRIGRLSDDEVVALLTGVKGIGPWTAQMFLLWRLQRPDVWPVQDLGVRVGYGQAWGLTEPPGPADLEQLGDRFRPYRSTVAWYCWRAAESRPRRRPSPIQRGPKSSRRPTGGR